MLQALQSGQIQVALGDYTTADAAKKAGFNVVEGKTSWDGFVPLTLGNAEDPLSDTSVRQALSYGIDRAKISDALLGKYGEPTSEWVTTDGFDPDYQDHFAYDPEKAKELLASAGYSDGLTLTVLDTSGRAQDGTPTQDMVNAAAEQLKQIGVTLKITTVPPSQSFPELLSGKYQLAAGYFGINPSQVYWNLFLSPDSVLNPSKWSPPQSVQDSFAQSSRAADPTADLVSMNQQLTEGGYPLPVYLPTSLVFAAKSVGGISFPTLPTGIANGTFPDPTEFRPS
jgi:peptide/nickel transport system substrate-binding protein